MAAAVTSVERDRRRDDERGAADDEREGEEERAGDAAGQRDQQGRDRDRDRALERRTWPARARRAAAGRGRRPRTARRSARRMTIAGCVSGHSPVAATIDGRRQEERPGDDPDDTVVGLGRDAVVGRRGPDAADDRRLRPLVAHPRSIGRDVARERARPAEQRRDQDDRHHDQVRRRPRRRSRKRTGSTGTIVPRSGGDGPTADPLRGHLSRSTRPRLRHARGAGSVRRSTRSARPVLVGLLDEPQVHERLGVADAVDGAEAVREEASAAPRCPRRRSR